MFNEIKKGMMAGLGAMLLTKDKIDEVTRRFVKEARISEEDARKLREELEESGEEQVSRLESRISEMVKKRMEKLGVSKKEEVDKLREKVETLELRVSVLEKEKGPAGARES